MRSEFQIILDGKKDYFIKAMIHLLEDKIDVVEYIARFYEIDSQIEESKKKL